MAKRELAHKIQDWEAALEATPTVLGDSLGQGLCYAVGNALSRTRHAIFHPSSCHVAASDGQKRQCSKRNTFNAQHGRSHAN